MALTVDDVGDSHADKPRVLLRGSFAGANCHDCPFSKLGRPSQPVCGIGPSDPQWIIVGESPGSLEQIRNLPFVGPSGKLINDALSALQVNRNDLYITNATLCKPREGATEGEKKLARKACGPRLKLELASYPGKPILALGSHAGQGLTNNDKFSITQMAGAYYEVDVDDSGTTRAVIPSIHPAAILRGGSSTGGGGSHTVDIAYWNLLYDIGKIVALAQGRDIFFTDDGEIEHQDPARAEYLIAKFCQDAEAVAKFSCDTETYVDNPKRHSALSPINAKIAAIGLATTKYGLSIAWEIITPVARKQLEGLFADETITKCFHNRVYDEAVLKRHGFAINGRIECTMLAHHNAFPGLSHNLQRVGTQFFAIRPWKSEHRFGTGSIEELLQYNRRDTLVTSRIEGPIAVHVKRNNAEKTYEVDLAMAKAAAQMHLDGIPISREVNEQLRSGFQVNIAKAKQSLDGRIQDPAILSRYKERLAFEQARRMRKGDSTDLTERIDKRLAEMDRKPFNFMIDSGDHIVAFLKACGVPLSIQTPSGRISTKKDILEAYVQYPEVRALLTYRENSKLNSTFVERMFDRQYGNKIVYGFVDPFDRVHPRWSVHKITSRWGSDHPGCQNWPKADPKKGRPNLRSQVVAPKGRRLVAFDMKAVEARLVALRSGDPFLLNIFRSNKDIHSEFARLVWPDFDQIDVNERKVRRDLVKRPEYCLVPGTKILRRDLTWQTIDTLRPSDELIGFRAQKDRWAEDYFGPSIVQRQKWLRKNCYRVITANGEVTSSEDHLWVVRPKDGGLKQWKRTDKLQIDDALIYMHDLSGKGIDAPIRAIKSVGKRDVIALQTSTETFIAEGFLSHNCSFYGGSPETAWRAVVRDYPNVTLSQIDRMVQLMRTRMPGIAQWHRDVAVIADREGEVRSMILGRRRCFPIKQFDITEAINFGIQSSTSDLINIGLMEIMPKLPKDAFPIIQIHDAVIFECNEDDEDLVKKLVVECFTRDVTYNGVTMHFPVDAKAGPSWDIVN